MNNLNTAGKWAVGALVVLVIVVVLTLYGGQNGPGTAVPNGTSTGATPNGNGGVPSSSTPATTATPTGTKNSGTGGTKQSSMTFITPIPGETWKIATQNPIQWSREGGVGGQIELLDATTLKLVGVILNQTAPHQTSYTWNTRDLLLTRTDPRKTTVMPGRYVIKIAFDGNNLSPITSQPITLTN